MISMTLRLSQIRKAAVLLIFISLATGLGYWFGLRSAKTPSTAPKTIFQITNKTQPTNYQTLDFSLFWDVWKRLENSYLDEKAIDNQKMFYGAISGMVASLGDPYTVFLPPEEQKQTEENLEGAFGGVGIQLGYKDKQLAVVTPLEGTPAQTSGIKAGDFILKITDKVKNLDIDTYGISLPDAVGYIRGPEGSRVTLTLFREGAKEPFTVELTRSTILVESVKLTFVDLPGGKTAAHLKLLRFGDRTQEEWDKAVAEILTKSASVKLAGIVLDLRNNPGGYLQSSVDLTSDFLTSGNVVIQEGKNGARETYPVSPNGRLTKIPLVVLVNQGSASAAEIMAGALQDNKRAKIIGEKTFGKGTVQEPIELPSGTGLHVTIARWLTPNGTSIADNGIKPQIEVAEDPNDDTKDPQLDKALEELAGQPLANSQSKSVN